MLKKCVEEDFYQIKAVAAGLLRPDRISGFFWITFIFSGIITGIVTLGIYGSGSYVTNPFWVAAVNISIVLLIIQFLVTLFYTNEIMAYRFQKIQSVISSFISLKSSIETYTVFLMFSEARYAPDYLQSTAFILCIGGLICLVFSTFRGMKRVQKGEFRKGGRGLYNFNQPKAYVSLPIIFGVIFMFGSMETLSASSSTFGQIAFLYVFLLFCVLLQYAVAFVWPEFFLLTYCKFRFESFQIPMTKRMKEKLKQQESRENQTKQTNTNKYKTKQKKARGRKK
jgi:hypothetical protein